MIHDEILHKWINNTISPEELKQFKERPEYEELLQLYDRTEDMEPPTFDTNEMLANILATDKKEVVEEKPEAKVVAFPNWAKLAIAAALIGLVAFFFLPLNDAGVEVATATNETKNIDMPDGSKITLYDNSYVKYSTKNLAKKREVKLTGKAKFEVEKGVPFTVITELGNVDVLGTIFTVDTRSQTLNVACSEGRVEVANGKFKKEITENVSVQMTAIEMMVKTEGLSEFKNTKLSDVLKEIKEEFGVTFELENMDVIQRLNGYFQHKKLEHALKTTVGTMSDVSYEIEEKKVIIRKK